MIASAPAPNVGGFVAGGERWTFAGTLTFEDAADVFEAARTLPLPTTGVVDLAGLAHADSSALAVMLALKRRAAVEGVALAFASVPHGLHTLAQVYGVEELLIR